VDAEFAGPSLQLPQDAGLRTDAGEADAHRGAGVGERLQHQRLPLGLVQPLGQKK